MVRKSLKIRQMFPLGKAYDQAFCNRVDETEKLLSHMMNGKHTFVVAPRRYGKSSLCERAITKSKLPAAKLDFHLALSAEDVERIILKGVSELISVAIGQTEKIIYSIKKFVNHLNPKLSLSADGVKVEFSQEGGRHLASNIAEGLLLLDSLLAEKKKQVVMLFDEFQEIGQVKESKVLEGAVRHAAQELKHISIIFCGSRPNLLRVMFEDERRPLYKLCRKLVLDRITANHYKSHLNKASKLNWEAQLNEDVFENIMELTERHPYYVNYLCDELWSFEAMPSAKQVNQAWSQIIEEDRSDLLKEFFTLSENQRKLLIFVANYGGSNIFSSESAKRMDMPTGSIQRSASVLLEKDFFELTKQGYRVINPLYKALLKTDKA